MKKMIFYFLVSTLLISNLYAISDYTKGFMAYKKASRFLHNSHIDKAQKYFAKALPFLEKATENNSASANFMLGRMYCNAWGVDLDYKKAQKYFQIAMNLGDKRAHCCIARLYLIKMKENINEGLKQFKIANSYHIKACKDIERYIEKNNIRGM